MYRHACCMCFIYIYIQVYYMKSKRIHFISSSRVGRAQLVNYLFLMTYAELKEKKCIPMVAILRSGSALQILHYYRHSYAVLKNIYKKKTSARGHTILYWRRRFITGLCLVAATVYRSAKV